MKKILLAAGLCLFFSPALAEKEQDARATLKATQAEISAAETRKKKLDNDTSKLKKELASLQKDLVALAKKVQASEKKIVETEGKLTELETQEKQKTDAKNLREQQLAAMVQTMIRMSRTPPEAIVAMPGDYANTLKTAKVLGVATDTVHAEAQAIRQQIEELHTLQDTIKASRDDLLAQKDQLKTKQEALAAKVKARNALQAQLNQKLKKENDHLADLSKKSASLKDLLNRLEEERKNTANKAEAPAESKKDMGAMKAARGRMVQPVAGIIIHRFGESHGRNDTAKGLTFRARDGAQVVAPYKGQVAFTGPFMNYGKMVIIRHSDGYHSLLAGLTNIDCKPGDFLLEGEPIGAMGKHKDNKDELYMELRRDNVPMDPGPWLNFSSRKRN